MGQQANGDLKKGKPRVQGFFLGILSAVTASVLTYTILNFSSVYLKVIEFFNKEGRTWHGYYREYLEHEKKNCLASESLELNVDIQKIEVDSGPIRFSGKGITDRTRKDKVDPDCKKVVDPKTVASLPDIEKKPISNWGYSGYHRLTENSEEVILKLDYIETNPETDSLGMVILRGKPQGTVFRGYWLGFERFRKDFTFCPYILTSDKEAKNVLKREKVHLGKNCISSDEFLRLNLDNLNLQ